MPVPAKNLAAKSAAAREPVGENGYNGRYLGQVPIPNNRPDQAILWSAIDTLKIESAKVGRIDVTVMIVPGKGVRGGKRRPKMLQMATQSGRFSLSLPFHQILSVGQVENHVVIVCWTRGQDTKRTKSFFVHGVEFKQADDAEAMSRVLIKERGKVREEMEDLESVNTRSPDKKQLRAKRRERAAAQPAAAVKVGSGSGKLAAGSGNVNGVTDEHVDVVKQDDDALGYAVAEEMMTDKDALLEVVKKNGSALSHASDTLKADEDVVLEAVRQNGLALEYAAARLKAHEGVVLTAVKENGLALEYAAARFKARKDVALIAVKQDGSALKYAGTHMKADKDVVLEAVKQDGRALKHVHKKWKADKDVVMEAVKQNGSALCRAADAMRVDKDIVMEAVKQDGCALYHAAEDLKSDKDVVMEAVKQNGLALEYAANVLRADEAVVLEAVKQNDSAVEYAADELKSTDQVMHTIEDNESATAFTTLELIEERSALFALRNSGRNILSTANSSENNSDIIKPALVDLLRQLNADSSKQQKALHRLERLMQLHHSLCATDDRVATTLTSASNGCAVAIVSTETIQQQAAKIQECLDGFDTAQRVLRKAARTPDVHDESGDDPSTANSLVSELAATVIKRNESRSHFCQNLGTFQSRWNDHLIIRLEYLKEKLDDLHKTRDLFAAGRNSGASDEGTFVRPLPDSIKDAVFAFDAWWARVKEVCESTTTSTDQAFADLGQHFSSALTHTVRGVTATDALEGQLAAVQEKLRTVAANVRIEKEYWASDPLRSLPYDRILTACGQISQSFEAEAAETEDMLQQVEEWDARAKYLREVPVYPTDLEDFFSLDDAVWELNKKLKRAHFDVEDFKEDTRRRKSSRTQSKLDDATKLAAKYHEELREAGAKFQVEKKRLKDLNKNHYPELALHFPDADLLGIADLDGLVDSSVTFESFGDGGVKEKLGSKGRHAIFKTFMNGTAVVLKRFDLENESDESKFRKEARKLKGLAHPNIIRLESVIIEDNAAYIHLAYQPGGDLQSWLDEQSPTPEQKQALLHQVCRGIEYLHANEILHCDIKLENILMTEASSSARPILADFDISKDTEGRALETQTGAATAVGGGTFIYMASEIKPRIAGGKGERQTTRSDMYAFGVVGLLVFSKAFRDSVDDVGDVSVLNTRLSDSQRKKLLLGGMDKDVPEAISLTIAPLLVKLLAHAPANRLSAAAAVNDPALAVDIVVRELAAQREAAAAEAAEQKRALEADREQARKETLARQQEAVEKAHALQRECCLCMDDYEVHEGVECPAPDGAEKHFICNDPECFSKHVIAESEKDIGSLAKRQGNIFCPSCCDESPAFTDVDVARHASVEAFASYTGGKQKLLEAKLYQEISEDEKKKFKAEMEQWKVTYLG